MPRSFAKRINGLSKSIAVHGLRGRARHVTILKAGRQAERMQQMAERRTAELEASLALSAEDQVAVERMYEDQGIAVHYDEPMPFSSADSGQDDDDDGYDTEEECPPDDRSRRDRIAIQHDQWDVQMSCLVSAYLDYRLRNSGDGFPSSEVPAVSPEADEEALGYPPGTVVDVELIDIFSQVHTTRRKATLIARRGHIYPNENLVYHGYIGCSPIRPSLAISLRTLAAFRQAHRTCPRFSIQALFLTARIFVHNLPMPTTLTSIFSTVSLGRESQDWRLRNECPACFYRLADEPSLTFDWLVSIDGNNSLKRWDTATYGMTPREDSRQPRLTYWLTNEEVDRFKYEVPARKTSETNERRDDDWEVNPDANSDLFNCVDRWRNARSDQHKKTHSVFEETGIFVVSCRHRFVLLACDMIKSGELAKYPLAIVDRLLLAYASDGGCAYNIGCAFTKTAENSIIGSRIRNLNLRFMVGSFHGYAHNRLCQLQWYPMYIEGVGNTEGEGCEHIFSASNELARSIRHATRFHCHQAIEEHFLFWNADKYVALTRFIRNHYREAIETVRSLSAELAVLKSALNLSDLTCFL
ncbi:hypothetical protein HD554DRAFT_2044479 [Boletus coccyginus]|nr:hypothetical protein HD554DRAFT_2044479 [Boletus coccyginus]